MEGDDLRKRPSSGDGGEATKKRKVDGKRPSLREVTSTREAIDSRPSFPVNQLAELSAKLLAPKDKDSSEPPSPRVGTSSEVGGMKYADSIINIKDVKSAFKNVYEQMITFYGELSKVLTEANIKERTGIKIEDMNMCQQAYDKFQGRETISKEELNEFQEAAKKVINMQKKLKELKRSKELKELVVEELKNKIREKLAENYTKDVKSEISSFEKTRELKDGKEEKLTKLISLVGQLVREVKNEINARIESYEPQLWEKMHTQIENYEKAVEAVEYAQIEMYESFQDAIRDHSSEEDAKKAYESLEELIGNPKIKTQEELSDFEESLREKTAIITQHYSIQREIHEYYSGKINGYISGLEQIIQENISSVPTDEPLLPEAPDHPMEMVDIADVRHSSRQGSSDASDSSNPYQDRPYGEPLPLEVLDHLIKMEDEDI